MTEPEPPDSPPASDPSEPGDGTDPAMWADPTDPVDTGDWTDPAEATGATAASASEAGPRRAAPPADRSRWPMLIGIGVIVLGVALIALALVARVVDDRRETRTLAATGTTAPPSDAGVGVGFGPEQRGRRPLRGFGEVKATVTSGDGQTCEVCLLAATSSEQRARGLMEVTDEKLGGYDGMVFVFDEAGPGAFWMRNTPMPLSIAYFDADGKLVSKVDMAKCGDTPNCPNYPAAAPFAYALEVPQGKLADVGVTGAAQIEIDAKECPLAAELKGSG